MTSFSRVSRERKHVPAGAMADINRSILSALAFFDKSVFNKFIKAGLYRNIERFIYAGHSLNDSWSQRRTGNHSHGMAYRLGESAAALRVLRITNLINEGNPHYRPYEVPSSEKAPQ